LLGERRSNSLFAPAAPAEPERKPEQAEVHDISFEERTGRSLFAETATAPRASELFFAPQEKGITFAEALSQVQGYLSETYATLITEDNSDAKEQMKRRMARYLQENRIAVDGMTASELVDALYTEMAEYGFSPSTSLRTASRRSTSTPGGTLRSSIRTVIPPSWRSISTRRNTPPMSSAVCCRTPARYWTMPAPSLPPDWQEHSYLGHQNAGAG
jgi:hypothetical protein